MKELQTVHAAANCRPPSNRNSKKQGNWKCVQLYNIILIKKSKGFRPCFFFFLRRTSDWRLALPAAFSQRLLLFCCVFAAFTPLLLHFSQRLLLFCCTFRSVYSAVKLPYHAQHGLHLIFVKIKKILVQFH